MTTLVDVKERVLSGEFESVNTDLTNRDALHEMANKAWSYYTLVKEALEAETGVTLSDPVYSEIYDYIQDIYWRGSYSGMLDGFTLLIERMKACPRYQKLMLEGTSQPVTSQLAK